MANRVLPFLSADQLAGRHSSAQYSGRHDGACLLLCRGLHPEAEEPQIASSFASRGETATHAGAP